MNEPARFVVDASVGVKWVIEEHDGDRARDLLGRVERGEATLRAPEIYVAEGANAIWQRVRRHELQESEARQALRTFRSLPPELVPTGFLVEQALELALAFRHPVYDCLYVALAMRDGAALITADEPLAQALGPATGQIILLRDFA